MSVIPHGKKKLISSSKEKVLEYKLEEASEQINQMLEV